MEWVTCLWILVLTVVFLCHLLRKNYVQRPCANNKEVPPKEDGSSFPEGESEGKTEGEDPLLQEDALGPLPEGHVLVEGEDRRNIFAIGPTSAEELSPHSSFALKPPEIVLTREEDDPVTKYEEQSDPAEDVSKENTSDQPACSSVKSHVEVDDGIMTDKTIDRNINQNGFRSILLMTRNDEKVAGCLVEDLKIDNSEAVTFVDPVDSVESIESITERCAYVKSNLLAETFHSSSGTDESTKASSSDSKFGDDGEELQSNQTALKGAEDNTGTDATEGVKSPSDNSSTSKTDVPDSLTWNGKEDDLGLILGQENSWNPENYEDLQVKSKAVIYDDGPKLTEEALLDGGNSFVPCSILSCNSAQEICPISGDIDESCISTEVNVGEVVRGVQDGGKFLVGRPKTTGKPFGGIALFGGQELMEKLKIRRSQISESENRDSIRSISECTVDSDVASSPVEPSSASFDERDLVGADEGETERLGSFRALRNPLPLQHINKSRPGGPSNRRPRSRGRSEEPIV